MNAQHLSISRRKAIAALADAKHRRESGTFVAEGNRCIADLMASLTCNTIVATAAWLEHPAFDIPSLVEVLQAGSDDMHRLSALSTSPQVLAVFAIPQHDFRPTCADSRLVVALDDVRDPGNMGTIIRACDWFGVSDIICTSSTVDIFNPKVVQSTMGALGRVAVHYGDLCAMLDSLADDTPVFGTFLDGDDINRLDLPSHGVIVMGNEAHGVSSEVASRVTRRLFIPPYPRTGSHVESLNVAMATAITLAAFRRNG